MFSFRWVRTRTAPSRVRPGDRRRGSASGQTPDHDGDAVHVHCRAHYPRGHDERYGAAGKHGFASLRDSQLVRENGKSDTADTVVRNY